MYMILIPNLVHRSKNENVLCLRQSEDFEGTSFVLLLIYMEGQFFGFKVKLPPFYNSTTMYPDTHSMHLDPQTRHRDRSSSQQLSPSGLNLSLPVPPHLREMFAAENDFSRAGSPALSTFQYHNEPNGAYISDGSDFSGLHPPVPYGRHGSERPGTYNRLTRDFLTHQTVRFFSFNYLPF